jgi:hypothetical protein
MSAMRIEYAGYASAKAFVILGLMYLFKRVPGKNNSVSTQINTITPMAMPAYETIFRDDSFRRSICGGLFRIDSISLLSLS